MSIRTTRRAAALSLALSLTLGLSACGGGSNSDAPSQPDVYGWSAVTALKITDTVTGTGTTAVAGSKLTVNYTGWIYDVRVANLKGSQFDSSLNPGRLPYTLPLGAGQVIQGWDQGLLGMKAGGTRTLIIPASMAYGSAGSGPIPPNAALVFDVQLISVQ